MPLVRRPPQQKSSAFATLAVLLFALAQMSALLHGMVRHTRCAEHGELIESSGAAPGVESTAVPVDVDCLQALVFGDDEHDSHCPLSLNPGSCGPIGFSATTLQLVTFELPALLKESVDSGVVVASGPAVLRVAPKQGPPASPSLPQRSV